MPEWFGPFFIPWSWCWRLNAVSRAQTPPPAGELLRSWRTGQQQRALHMPGLIFREHAVRRSSSPAGMQRLTLEAVVHGTPDTETWTREILSVQSDSPRRPAWLADSTGLAWDLPGHPEIAHLTGLLTLPASLLDRLDVTGEATPDTIDGLACWRFDAVPARSADPVRRVTFWFTRAENRLARTRLLLQHYEQRNDRPLRLTLEAVHHYERFQGLDLPVWRRFEGTRQHFRRGRLFTDVVMLEARYSDFHLADR
ncbi:MAG: hypothetical protein KatS3mg043_1753 [Rhodothermaceae bacterium]|nr:MAG: hypothetical protein KatS3mg043_1753 [Rhodothermaceae bacterium]